jgi:phage shock protein PspC (stress-responsive transcriptional regulator)
MLWLIRVGAYLLSGAVVWNFVQDAAGPEGFFQGRRLALDTENGLIFGVCAGLARFTGFDVTFLRLGWALAALYRGVGVALYILAFLLMPM